MNAAVTTEQVQALGAEQIPFVDLLGFRVEAIGYGTATLRAPYDERFLRPGGTISGPVVMGLADFATFAAVLSRIGLEPMAVTTNLNINFLRRPEPADLIANGRVLKVGRRLAVCDIDILSASTANTEEKLVAHATATYSLPPGLSATS